MRETKDNVVYISHIRDAVYKVKEKIEKILAKESSKKAVA